MHVPKVTLSLKKWSQSLWPSRAQFSSGKLINARWPCQFSKWVWMKTNNRNIVKLASSLVICERKSGWSLLLVFCNHISSWSWWLGGGRVCWGPSCQRGIDKLRPNYSAPYLGPVSSDEKPISIFKTFLWEFLRMRIPASSGPPKRL